ncbi:MULTISPECIES: hypothetical protein [unclassified Lysinibacillus]|uniref:hypothetical protein n=1 Tax=unclassified Lysinibacillus TaxID=2636778 RepID=UPI0011205B83|nr:hypothetical protein [Lysinibacillus sp. CD3-6]QPQ35159.1 hypothetical protein JNUCC52_21925 [Lysinibacillus sp. JNUCC-52]UED78840.1 hypothetical protein FH508_0015445 [Lysinibacillus sp. CD3-6]
MKIRFDLEEDDVSVLKNKTVHADYYLDSYLEVFVLENNKETLLFSTTLHSTIVIELNHLLIDLYQTGEERVLDTFGNANVYTYKKEGKNIVITNFDEFSDAQEWQYIFDFMEFTKAYTKELKRYLQAMVAQEPNNMKRPNFKLLSQGLAALEAIVEAK